MDGCFLGEMAEEDEHEDGGEDLGERVEEHDAPPGEVEVVGHGGPVAEGDVDGIKVDEGAAQEAQRADDANDDDGLGPRLAELDAEGDVLLHLVAQAVAVEGESRGHGEEEDAVEEGPGVVDEGDVLLGEEAGGGEVVE